MKCFVGFIFLVSLLMAGICGCKKEGKRTIPVQLQALVTKINEQPGLEMANGLVLDSCNIAPDDSLLTYFITVKDKRFNGLESDSIKSLFAPGLEEEGKRKLLTVLKKYSLGLRYECTLPDKTEKTIVFDPTELAGYGQAAVSE